MQSFNEWEQGADQSQPTGGEGGVTPPDEQPVQMPLGLSGEEMAGELDGVLEGGFSAPRSGTSGRVLLLVLVLAVGGGTLWAMRMGGGSIANGVTASADEARIDQALRQFQAGGEDGDSQSSPAEAINELFRDTDHVITLFGDDPTANQVGLENLQKNPFELYMAEGEGDGSAVRAIDRVRDERQARLRSELDRMSVQSLLSGATSLAVISGQVLREGDTIGSFTVTGISPYGVRLSAEGNTYTLTMEKER